MESVGGELEKLREALVWDRLVATAMLVLIPALCSVVWRNLQIGLPLWKAAVRHLRRRARWLAALVDPDLSVTFAEYEPGGVMMGRRSGAYEEVKAYLAASCSRQARHLRAERAATGGGGLVLSMADGEEVADVFRGATVWWSAHTRTVSPPRGAADGFAEERHGSYTLQFHERHRDLVLGAYLAHVQDEGRGAIARNRQRKLFTNLSSSDRWTTVSKLDHPKTFATVAMGKAKRDDIIRDLDTFRGGRDDYARVGSTWKRGYLLYGPPGTGKTSLVAAMAHRLDYDVYVLQLASVKSDGELLKLCIDIRSKAVVLIEDIDCAAGLTKKRADVEGGSGGGSGALTLSGLLNFVDGLWSACGQERIIVFTTNHVDKLDEALIRRGRMDKHVKMGYCRSEEFRSLLEIYHVVGEDDDSSHDLPAAAVAVSELLEEVDMTPADVIEYLPKSRDDDADACLKSLKMALLEKKAAKAAKEEDAGRGA